MNLKQRIFCASFLISFIVALIFLSINRVVPNGRISSHIVNVDEFERSNVLKDYYIRIEKLKVEVHKIKKTFLTWREHLFLNRRRKNISIDILNHGHQRHCKQLTLLYMVSSEVSHVSRRNIIRSTWINQSHWKAYNGRREVSFGMLFLVGRSSNDTAAQIVQEESKKHGDLLILDLDESFYSLSYKVMVGFQWITENCEGYRFLLKGDDDIFVNFHALMNLLHEDKTPKDHLYVGNRMYISEVVRNGRYGVSREEYKRDTYPRYNSGGGFVVSADVVQKMIPHFDWKAPLKIDDAFMGALILKAGVDCIQDDRFRMFERTCNFVNTTIVLHTDNKIVIRPECATLLNNKALRDGMRYLDEEERKNTVKYK